MDARDLLDSRSPTRRPPLLSVVIVNFNAWPDVVRLTRSLASSPELQDQTCEVVVVDNCSSGNVPPEMVELAWKSGVRLILRPDNGGFAVGVNTGWQASASPWLLVLNPDVVVAENLLGDVVNWLSRHDAEPTLAPGIVGFGLRNPDGTRQGSVGAYPTLARVLWEQLIPRSRRKYQAGWRTHAGRVAWVTGACMLLNARLMEVLGGMDEDFFLYHEEVDLCRRATTLGWTVEYHPEIELVHLHPLQNRPISPKMRVITRHSKLLYFRKHLPRWQFVTLARVVAAEAAVRGALAWVQGRTEDVRAWRNVREIARELQTGVGPRGREVLALAESVSAPSSPQKHTGPARTVPARTLRGATRKASVLEPRKDGPACR